MQQAASPATDTVVQWMRRENIGAVFFEGAWRWRDSFEGPDGIALAERFVEAGKAPGGFTGECLRR